MSRTERRIRHVTEAASLRIGAGLVCQAPNADCVWPSIRARCEKDARRDLCGGRGATRVSAATQTWLELVVNLHTAKTLVITVPPDLPRPCGRRDRMRNSLLQCSYVFFGSRTVQLERTRQRQAVCASRGKIVP
jgi:hypothetical protein